MRTIERSTAFKRDYKRVKAAPDKFDDYVDSSSMAGAKK